MIVPILNRPDLLQRMLGSIDVPVDRVVVVDNGGVVNFRPGMVLPHYCIAETNVVSLPQNIGVAASWNLGIKLMPKASWFLIVNNDITFAPGDLAKIAEAVVPGEAGIWQGEWFSAFAITPQTIEKVGWFDENFGGGGYCLVPETLVLTADLRWIPIGDVQVGTELIGPEEKVLRHAGRQYQRSTVLAVRRRRAPVVRISFLDGREVICTLDHRWLAKRPAGTMQWIWKEASTLRSGWWIASPLNVWRDATSFDEGWLAGMLDGEGCLHHTTRMAAVAISQKEGVVFERVKRQLEAMRIPYTWRIRKPNKSGSVVAHLEISARRDAVELLGRLRPQRLMKPQIWEGRSLRSPSYPSGVRIDAIEPLGDADVVDISTSTKTFMANGLVSHNCEDDDYAWRCHLAGVPIIKVPTGITHEASSTIKSDPWYWDQNLVSFPANVDYYERKWGGHMKGGEKFETPFNAGGRIDDVTPDFARIRKLSWQPKNRS